jgi:hypothetical protein
MAGAGQPYLPSAAVPGLEDILIEIRGLVETAVTQRRVGGKLRSTGAAALTSLIRSQNPIRRVHAHIAEMLYDSGLVAAERIQFERALPTPFDGKDEDVVVIPRGCDKALGEQVLAIGVKSQLTSVGKNQKNNFASVRNEATDFHETFPAQVVGHVHLMVLNEVDNRSAKRNKLVWAPAPQLARHISWFAKINGRSSASGPHQHMERVGLLLVDFAPETPRIYRSVEELVADGWVSRAEVEQYSLDLDGMLFDEGFIVDLLAEHERRFPDADLG